MTERLDTSIISEKSAEEGIVACLSLSPLYRERHNSAFNAVTLLDVAESVAFIKVTQPKEWTKLSKQFPGEEETALASHLSSLIQKRGTLDVLRNGISFNGINLHLAYFRPAAQGNPNHQTCYEGNRFSIMRQLHFSTKTPDQSVDIAIFLNGLPIVSLELKNHFTSQCWRGSAEEFR